MPSLTCWRPKRTASPRRSPVHSSTSSQTRLARANRPTGLTSNNVFLCPWRKSVAVPMRWVVNAQRRIGLSHLGLCRPTEKAAHGVKEMASLNWCRGAPISARARFWHKAGLPGAVSQCPLSGTADRVRLLLANPNKIRRFLQSVVPANRAGTTMGRPKQSSNNSVGSPSEPGAPGVLAALNTPWPSPSPSVVPPSIASARMSSARAPSICVTNATAGTCSTRRQPLSAPPMRWHHHRSRPSRMLNRTFCDD